MKADEQKEFQPGVEGDKIGGESESRPGRGVRPTNAEIEIIERKLKSAIALCEEGLNRLRELKAS